MSFRKKTDRYGQKLNPGDICVYDNELVIYKRESWGGKGISKGEYGQFIAISGIRSIKFSNVVFAFDPLGKRRNQSREAAELCRKFYEEK